MVRLDWFPGGVVGWLIGGLLGWVVCWVLVCHWLPLVVFLVWFLVFGAWVLGVGPGCF